MLTYTTVITDVHVKKTGGQQLASHAKIIGRGAYVKVPLCPPSLWIRGY